VTYEVVFTATAQRDLSRISPRIVPAIIEFAFGDLADAPRRVGKPLQRELDGLFGARRGPYRILYAIKEDLNRVETLRVDYRSDVYRGM
jgi:mRNA interferase RelE/StbE